MRFSKRKVTRYREKSDTKLARNQESKSCSLGASKLKLKWKKHQIFVWQQFSVNPALETKDNSGSCALNLASPFVMSLFFCESST